MDRAILEQHLALAEQHVTVGEACIQRQREIVALLDAAGHCSLEATRLLHTFEQLLAIHFAHRDRLLAELHAARHLEIELRPTKSLTLRSSTDQSTGLDRLQVTTGHGGVSME